MRDTRKSKEYFTMFLEYQYDRILSKKSKLAQCEKSDVDKQNRINITLMGYKINALIAEFSSGASTDVLKKSLESCCRTAGSLKFLGYETSIRLLSLIILLDHYENSANLVRKALSECGEDKLIRCLAGYITDKSISWIGDFLFPDIYDPLNKVFQSVSQEEQVDALAQYLSGWYQSCAGSSWFDTLENKHNVYYGYWSFESAAVAKILDIPPCKLQKYDFFPVL